MSPEKNSTDSASNAFKPFQISRRSFMQKCAMIAAATGLPLWAVERELASAQTAPAPVKSPNSRPGIALIGCGGQGTGDLMNAANYGDVVALCDVDSSHIDGVLRRLNGGGGRRGRNRGANPTPTPSPTPGGAKTIAKYGDFRKLLEDKNVDIIVTACPDHWHTLVNLAVAKAKKDMYSEKPMTLTIDEGKHVVKAVKDAGIVMQVGTQQRSDIHFRTVCELVRNGRLGKLKKVTVWLPAGLRGGPFPEVPAPSTLNWDFWQGQTPAVPYVKERCHTTFRYWYCYSGGTMTDWGAHHLDIAYWGIGQLASKTAEGKPNADLVAGGYTAYSDYDVIHTYADGTVLEIKVTHDDDGFGGIINPAGQRNGINFEGENGWLWVNRQGFKASDQELLRKPLPEGAIRLYNSKNHMDNFMECVKSRKETICPVEVGHRSASMCHIGNAALRSGKKLTWDAEKEVFVGENAEVGNSYLVREMRKPYDYSFVA